jgi:putative membrane protein
MLMRVLQQLLRALHELGFAPIVAICLYRVVTLVLNARAWQLLLPPAAPPRLPTLLHLRWIGESVNGLLPVAQVGGDVARASLVAARGVPPPDAAATMIADLSAGIVTQVLFALGGAMVFADLRVSADASRQTLLAIGIAAVPVLAILALHAYGHKLASHLTARSSTRGRLAKLAGGLTRLDESLTALLARERAMAASLAWHLLAWLSQVGETWLLLTLVGSPVTLAAAFVIESMATAARSGAFFVPGGLGVQEMAIVSTARLVGVELDVALALGIAKRAREILVGAPGLVAWGLATRAVQRLRGGSGSWRKTK